MKRLKNYQKTICGIRYKLFTIIKNNKFNSYHYYTNAYFSINDGDCLFYKSKTKSKLLNKYMLNIIGLFYSAYTYLIKYLLAIIFFPLYMYFYGMINFIKDKSCVDNIRSFTWINFIGFILCLIYIIINNL